MMKKFSIFIATDSRSGIGKNGDLAWRIPEDMKYLKNTTTYSENPEKQNAVIMGRKTWESIPKKFRPFPQRLNCILTRACKNNSQNSEGAFLFHSLDACMSFLEEREDIASIFIFGGAQIYNSILSDPRLEKIYLTQVFGDFNCDVFFDGVPEDFEIISESGIQQYQNIKYQFLVYQKTLNSKES